MSPVSNGGWALLAMSDDAFTYLLLLIGAGAYALVGVVWMVALIVKAVRGV